MTTYHIPVLTNEVLHFLAPQEGKVIVDCTLGTGGHSETIVKLLGNTGKLIGIDADGRNLEIARDRLKDHPNVTYIHGNFRDLESLLNISPLHHVNGFLFDLGLSSLHVDNPERGFSFRYDGPLDMRFDATTGPTAADIVNTYSPNNLKIIFQEYGQERFTNRIVEKIIEHRRRSKFTSTQQLARCIESAVGYKPGGFVRIHPATRVFQALRIATNREVEALMEGLRAALTLGAPGCRIVVISYHSLEDRIVKNYFRTHAKEGMLTLLTKKPIVPTEEEIAINRRSRSAKLRAAEVGGYEETGNG